MMESYKTEDRLEDVDGSKDGSRDPMYLSIIKITLLNLKVTLTENNRTVIYLCTLM